MALSLFPSPLFSSPKPNPNPNPNRNPNPNPSRSVSLSLPHLKPSPHRHSAVHFSSNGQDLPLPTSPPPQKPSPSFLLFPLVASAFFLIGLRARACPIPPSPTPITQSSAAESAEDEEFKAAFEQWKSKTYALTVPLRIVALRGSIPPQWIKDFFQVQGKRLKFSAEYRASIEDVFLEMSEASKKGDVEGKSAMAADLVSVGDSWLSLAIRDRLIEPMKDVEEQEWFKSLSDRWKVRC